MKKKLLMLLTIFALLGTVLCPMNAFAKTTKKTTTEKKKEPINMYVFYSGWCPHCSDLHNYLDNTLTKDEEYKSMFNVVYIELEDENENSSDVNKQMFSTVSEHFEYTSGSIPFFVIGDEYSSGFSDSSTPTKIKSMITKAYNDKKYKDVVSSLVDLSKVETIVAPEEAKSDRDNNLVGYIVLGVTAIAIVAIIFGRSKNTYEEE